MDINKIMPGRIDKIAQTGIVGIKTRSDFHEDEKAGSGADFRLTKENISDLTDVLNSASKSINQRVSFRFHEKTNRIIMQVVDANTKEVIREIPPKEMIRLLEHMHELIGMFVDESR